MSLAEESVFLRAVFDICLSLKAVEIALRMHSATEFVHGNSDIPPLYYSSRALSAMLICLSI